MSESQFVVSADIGDTKGGQINAATGVERHADVLHLLVLINGRHKAIVYAVCGVAIAQGIGGWACDGFHFFLAFAKNAALEQLGKFAVVWWCGGINRCGGVAGQRDGFGRGCGAGSWNGRHARFFLAADVEKSEAKSEQNTHTAPMMKLI